MSNKEKAKKRKDVMDKNRETKALRNETAPHDKKDSKILSDSQKNDIQVIKEKKVAINNNDNYEKMNQSSNNQSSNKENHEIIKSNNLINQSNENNNNNEQSNEKNENNENNTIIKKQNREKNNSDAEKNENITKKEMISQNDIQLNIEENNSKEKSIQNSNNDKNSLSPTNRFNEKEPLEKQENSPLIMNTSINDKDNQNNNKSIEHSYDVLFENNTLLLSTPNSIPPTQPSSPSIFSFTDIHPETLYHLK